MLKLSRRALQAKAVVSAPKSAVSASPLVSSLKCLAIHDNHRLFSSNATHRAVKSIFDVDEEPPVQEENNDISEDEAENCTKLIITALQSFQTNPKLALSYLNKAIETMERSPALLQQMGGEVYLTRGNLLKQEGKFKEAVADYDASLAAIKSQAAATSMFSEFKDTEYMVRSLRAESNRELGDHEEAIRDYTIALQLYEPSPENVGMNNPNTKAAASETPNSDEGAVKKEILLNRGKCYQALEDHTNALEDFEQALMWSEKSKYTQLEDQLELHQHRVLSSESIEDYKTAIAEVTKMVDKLLQRNVKTDAVQIATRILQRVMYSILDAKKGDTNPSAKELLADCKLIRQYLEQAKIHTPEAKTAMMEEKVVIVEAEMYLQEKQYDKAIRAAEEAMLSSRISPQLLFTLGTAYLEKGEYQSTLDTISEPIDSMLVEMSSKTDNEALVQLLLLRAKAYKELQDYDAALSDCHRASYLDKKMAQPLLSEIQKLRSS